MKMKLNKNTFKYGLLFSVVFVGSYLLIKSNPNLSHHFTYSDTVLYLEDNVCMMNATDERSDEQMRADVEECITLRKETKE